MTEIRMDIREQSDEEIAYIFAAWRLRQALEQAPDIAMHVRSIVLAGSRTEAGVEHKVQRTPLLTQETDDVDELYTELINWVIYWAEKLNIVVPQTTMLAWKDARHETLGLRAGATVSMVSLHTRLQTLWLLSHHETITAHPYGPHYVTTLTDTIWAIKNRYPTQDRPPRQPLNRPCPVCAEETVTAVWFYEDQHEGVDVRCSHCGWTADRKDVRRLVSWIPGFETWAIGDAA